MQEKLEKISIHFKSFEFKLRKISSSSKKATFLVIFWGEFLSFWGFFLAMFCAIFWDVWWMIFEDLKAVLTQQVFWVIVLTIFLCDCWGDCLGNVWVNVLCNTYYGRFCGWFVCSIYSNMYQGCCKVWKSGGQAVRAGPKSGGRTPGLLPFQLCTAFLQRCRK